MRAFRLLILLKFIVPQIATANLYLWHLNIEATKPRSVNLALETVLEFDQNNKTEDLKFINSVQKFLDKVKNVIWTNSTSDNKNIKFIDFVKSVIHILKSFDDDDLEEVFTVFDDEIREYHYRGCKFYELLEDQNVRRFVTNKLEDVKDKPAETLRQNLDSAIRIIEDAKFSGPRAEFLDYVNSLYREDSADKLQEFLNNLQTYSTKTKRANLNLIKVVQDGIRSVIFDHYSRLNENARRNLKIKLETSWRNLKHPDIDERNIWTVQYTNSYFDSMEYRNTNNKTRDIKKLTTQPFVSTPITKDDSESEDNEKNRLSTTRYSYKKSNKTYNAKEVYFNKEAFSKFYNNDNDFENEVATSETQDLVSSESHSDEIPTTTNSKQRKNKNKTKQKTTKEYVIPKTYRQTQKKISTFITLYPEGMTADLQRRFKIKPATNKARLFTLWEEKMKPKNVKKDKKLQRSKSKTNLRTGVDKPKAIADTDTIINVKRAVLTSLSSEDKSTKHKNERNRKTSPTKKHQTQTTQGQYKPTTRKKFRKSLAELTSIEDVSGISIESFEIRRRSLLNKQNTENEIKDNVLGRINQLEKQMQEVKIKIDTKLTNNASKVTFAPLEFWIDTTATADKVNTTAINNITAETTKQSTKHVTFETTTTINKDSNKSIEITTKKENILTQTTKITENVEDIKNTSVPEQNQQILDLPDEANDFGNDEDNVIDDIMKKYTFNVTPTADKPFNFDKFLKETKTENNKENKDSKVKEIIKNYKNIFEEKPITGRSDTNVPIEAYHDLNAVLDLGEDY